MEGIGSSAILSLARKSPYYSWWIIPVLILATCLAVVYNRWKKNVQFAWSLPGFDYSPLQQVIVFLNFLRGNKTVDPSVLIFQMSKGYVEVFSKEKLMRVWIGFKPFILCYRAEAYEAVIGNPVNLRKDFGYSFLTPWLKFGLLTSSGEKWRWRRKLLTPAFHFRILGDFLPTVESQAHILVNKMKVACMKEWVDVVPMVTRCTLDVICETAMGIHLGSQSNWNCEYLNALHEVAELFPERFVKPWIWSNFVFFYFTEGGKKFRKNAAILENFTRSVIRKRKAEMLEAIKNGKSEEKESEDEFGKKKRQPFLDLLLRQHIGNGTLSEDDILEEVDSFMFAGHDTTALATSWSLYLLGHHPEHLQRAQEEVDTVLGKDDRPMTLDDLRNLKFLECVVKEALRLFPSVPLTSRDLDEDVYVDGHRLAKGTTCIMFTYALHRDPNVFPNPEKFDPDRFLPENSAGRHPYAYVPFSAGSRNCIGQRFALLEEKTVLANLLRHFDFCSVDPLDKLELAGEMIMRSKNGIRIKVSERKNE